MSKEENSEDKPAQTAREPLQAKAKEKGGESVSKETPSQESSVKAVSGKEAETPDQAKGKEGEKKKGTAIADLLKDELAGAKIRRAKGSKNITSGVVHVVATFNNTKVTVTDTKGNVISWSSAGKCNFRGSRKSTAYAAQVVTQDAARAAMAHGLKEVRVHLKGPGLGRDSAVRALQALGVIVLAIVDKTPVPHNGCRPPKRRRV